MKNIFLLIICIIALSSCKNKPTEHQKDFPLLLNLQKSKNDFKKDSSISKSTSSILYIGNLKDSIKLDYTISSFPFNPPPPPLPSTSNSKLKEWKELVIKRSEEFEKHPASKYYRFLEYYNDYLKWSKSNILIKVDTSKIVKQKVIENYKEEYYPALPVLLQNLEKDTIVIGYDRFIPVLLEAKDSTSRWKPIETIYKLACGNGINSILLPPNEIVITSKRIFQGNYKTKLRIKIGNNYSNPFTGRINYSQFNLENKRLPTTVNPNSR